MKNIAFIVLSLVFLISCNNDNKTKELNGKTEDVLLLNMDTSIRPGDDFFAYANGGWINNTVIPEAESGWGIGNMVQDDIYKKLKKINEDAALDNEATGVNKKIGTFWKTAMDSTSVNSKGLRPLQNLFTQIDAIQSSKDITRVLAMLHSKGINAGFNLYVSQDDKKSDEMALNISQGGLGLPNRDYYFNTDARTNSIREGYKTYISKTLAQWDTGNVAALSQSVYALQEQLAKSSRKIADLRDPYKNYNKMSWQKLQQLAPQIDWTTFKNETRTGIIDSVIIGQPEFLSTLSETIKDVPLPTWKNYLKLKVVQENADYLDSSTFNNYFNYSRLLTGATVPKERWKRVLDAEEETMGEMLGQLFVKEYFSPEAKERYTGIVENIREAFKERIQKLDWMSDSTKQRAYVKLAKLGKKVGYPDTWKNFDALKISDSSWVTNMLNAGSFWFNYRVAKLGKPVDRSEWEMTPQTYNAYYNPSNNEMVLPAGIFSVPGYRDADLDDALVYGYAAASTIGHELTHGFDDQGRQYDDAGNLQNWWAKSDEKQFSERAGGIIRQFNAYSPVDTFHINGEATQGENIADLGGMLLGLDAFKKTDTYKKGEKISGLTPLQRYFLGYALGWQYISRKETLARRVLTDVHSPAKERVNGPVVNVPEWYEAFNVKPGDKMYVPDSLRVKIW